tara:strand:+ start:537 stop:761 length:225 start_codon:yes stop_codon:yes gene_type:complete
MKISEQQAVDYIEAARDLSGLSALLLEQGTGSAEEVKNKIEAKAASALYWLWFLVTEYLSEEEVKHYIKKYEEK